MDYCTTPCSSVKNFWRMMHWQEKLWVLLRAASSQNLPAMYKRRQAQTCLLTISKRSANVYA